MWEWLNWHLDIRKRSSGNPISLSVPSVCHVSTQLCFRVQKHLSCDCTLPGQPGSNTSHQKNMCMFELLTAMAREPKHTNSKFIHSELPSVHSYTIYGLNKTPTYCTRRHTHPEYPELKMTPHYARMGPKSQIHSLSDIWIKEFNLIIMCQMVFKSKSCWRCWFLRHTRTA